MVDRRRDLLRFRIELADIAPLIWREILVPAYYSCWDLHVAIQDAMGWLDYHLHEFRSQEGRTNNSLLIGIPDEGMFNDMPEVLPGWEIDALRVFSQPGDRMLYEYDFGDGWMHSITLLGIERREKGVRYPRCVAGERACPPEDCGGAGGYAQLLEVLFDPGHPDYESIRGWIPRGWGPELFNPGEVRFDNPQRRWEIAFQSGE